MRYADDTVLGFQGRRRALECGSGATAFWGCALSADDEDNGDHSQVAKAVACATHGRSGKNRKRSHPSFSARYMAVCASQAYSVH